MSDQFNQLLLQTLKEVGIRLERLEGRVDHVINEKADKSDISDVKSDISDVKSDVSSVKSHLNGLQEELNSQGRRIDRIETGIRTLQWTVTVGLAVLGVILAFIKAF